MKIQYTSVFFACLMFLFSCNLEQEIEIDLPAFEAQLVVECYLEPGKNFRMALLETVDYFDIPDLPIVQGAFVTISYAGTTDTLNNIPQISPEGKFYNYTHPKLVPIAEGIVFDLYVRDTLGRELRASTRSLARIPIDSSYAVFNSDNSAAYILLEFSDPIEQNNYYRRAIHKNSLIPDSLQIEFEFDDEFADDGKFVLGTGYFYKSGDTIINSLYHIEEAYLNYLETVDAAELANFSPFAQPTAIASNVEGGLGIFTSFTTFRDTLIIP